MLRYPCCFECSIHAGHCLFGVFPVQWPRCSQYPSNTYLVTPYKGPLTYAVIASVVLGALVSTIGWFIVTVRKVRSEKEADEEARSIRIAYFQI